ncbi:hypothetical protein WME73_18000 [Sorangium sp. So ce302]|uniref:hypothetical protein n=1 Tax=unclassified Sorangium TaxID=2621164 RepID=UPI003F5DB559
MTAFARVPARLQQAIVSRLGWTSLRPVQEMAGEAILDGKNAVVLAPTSGALSWGRGGSWRDWMEASRPFMSTRMRTGCSSGALLNARCTSSRASSPMPPWNCMIVTVQLATH